MNKGLFTSKTNEWYTPLEFFYELNNEFNFTLDPCCTKHSAKCDKYYTKEDDGLSKSWRNEIVFVNPPYGRDIKDWVRKSYISARNATIVMLIPARTDTIYWHDYIFDKADDIRFLKGRLKFEDINGNKSNPAPFPSAVIVFKNRKEKRLHKWLQNGYKFNNSYITIA